MYDNLTPPCEICITLPVCMGRYIIVYEGRRYLQFSIIFDCPILCNYTIREYSNYDEWDMFLNSFLEIFKVNRILM